MLDLNCANLLRLVLWPSIWSILVNAFKNVISILLILAVVFYKYPLDELVESALQMFCIFRDFLSSYPINY